MAARRFEFYQPTPLLRELGILEFLSVDPNSSQKRIAGKVGLGTAMVHAYLHAFQEQGLVEFRGSSSKKLQYVLTAKGRKVLESLASKHLTEVNRLIGDIQASITRCVQRAASDGVHRLAVISEPSIRDMIERMDIHSDVHLIFPRIEALDPDALLDGMGSPPDALLIALMAIDDRFTAAIESLQREGMPVYRAV